MSNERLSRALMEVGGGLGQMAEVALTRERDEAERIHRESMDRLRAKRSDQRLDKELQFREKENKLDRSARASEGSQNRALTERRMSQEELRQIERSAMGEIDSIDKRLLTLRDKMLEMQADTLGAVNPEVVAQMQDEMSELELQRRMTYARMMTNLKQAGDRRYKDLDFDSIYGQAGFSKQEIDRMKAIAGQGDGASGGSPGTASDQSPGSQSGAPAQRPGRAPPQGPPSPHIEGVKAFYDNPSRPAQLAEEQAPTDQRELIPTTAGRMPVDNRSWLDRLQADPLVKSFMASPVFNAEQRALNEQKARDFMDEQKRRELMARE